MRITAFCGLINISDGLILMFIINYDVNFYHGELRMSGFPKGIAVFLLILSSSFFILAQDDSIKKTDCGCPEQLTHSSISNYSISIEKIRAKYPDQYNSQPSLASNADSIVKLIVFPEIALRAEISGINVFRLFVDSTGNTTKVSLEKGLGAGLDECCLDALKYIKFTPAVINNKNVNAEVLVYVKFEIKHVFDEPEFILDEIQLEFTGNMPYFQKLIVLKKDGKAHYREWDRGQITETEGSIDILAYSHLSDFILSQCFFNYNDKYYSRVSDRPKTIISVKIKEIQKSVSVYAGAAFPVGFWGIQSVILKIKNDINWTVIKKSSAIKELPPK